MEETEDLVATPQFRWLGAVGDSSATVSSLAYDARRDFLWVGDAVGRVSTYSILLDSANDSFTVDAPNMVRYSSFSAASGPVLQIIPSEWSTVVVSPKSLRMISAGGMGQAKAPFPEFNYENNRMSDGFTCGSFLESQLFFGGSSSSISYIYDVAALSSGIASPVTSCDLHCSTVSVASTNETLVAAGSDGRIRLLDAQMRTSTVNGMLSVLKRVEAFSGSITDLCLSEDGRTAVACGMLKRAINPYDSNSPFQFLHDVHIRIFDLRMQRQLSGPSIPPVVIPRVNGATSGFRFVRLISSGGVIPAPIDAQTFGRRSCSGTYDWEKLLICTEDGTLQYLQLEADESSDIYSSFTASTTQVAYAPLSVAIGNAQVETLTAAAVSSTGDFTAIGTSAGVVGQYYRVLSATDEAHYIPKINKYSPNSKVTDQHLLLHQGEPTNFKKPLLSLPIDSLVLGTAYTICPPRSMLYADSITGRASHCPIASSYGNTPKLANTRLRFTSSRLVHNDVRTAMVKHDFIGTVSNASFKFGSNSMLYGTNAKRAYQNCDPRKGVTNSEIPEIPLQLFGDGSKNIDFANPTSSDFTSAPIPSNYKLLRSFRSGKSRVRRFDYSLYNKTSYLGLENNLPYSYVNPVLQIFYGIPSMRKLALQAQASTWQHRNPLSLWCELGFLFHSMQLIEDQLQSGDRGGVSKVARASSFVSTYHSYRKSHDVVALGLFDDSIHQNLQLTSQLFFQFFLKQICKEKIDSKISPKFVDEIFGLQSVSTTTFLQSKVTETDKSLTKSNHLELFYSQSEEFKSTRCNMTSNITSSRSTWSGKRGSSFSKCLWDGLRKETYMRGWCSSSKTYEPFRKVWMATSLPQILTILAGDTSKPLADNLLATALGENNLGSIHENFWRSYEGNSLSNDCSEWLPIEVEILLHQKVKSGETRLHVSSKVLSKLGHTHWNIFDGVNELMSQPLPASNHSTNDAEEYTFETYKYSLTAVVSEIGNGGNANSPFMEKSNEIIHDQWRGVVTDDAHLVLHMKRPGNSEAEQKNGCWYFYNDFLVEKCSEVDVVSFPTWRKPCFLQFAQLSYSSAANHRNMSKQDQNMFEEIAVKEISSTDRLFVPIPSTVLSLESISKIPGVSLTKLPDSQLPNAGDLIGFDGEFVSVSLEKTEIKGGQRMVSEDGRQVLARISLIDYNRLNDLSLVEKSIDLSDKSTVRILADDYILPNETVVDYVTRFSGVTAEDLDPTVSKRTIITPRSAYLKLRFFIDRRCIIVGHGLDKDFETANIFVPPSQIRDTVNLWRLPNQRKISLRFLAYFVLKADIQDDIHDSIEDSKTAMMLYHQYRKLCEQHGDQHIFTLLTELYQFGNKNNWTIGLEKLSLSY